MSELFTVEDPKREQALFDGTLFDANGYERTKEEISKAVNEAQKEKSKGGKHKQRGAKWISELWVDNIPGELYENADLPHYTDYEGEVNAEKVYKKPTRESHIIRSMILSHCYPQLVSADRPDWKDTEDTQKLLSMLRRTTGAAFIVNNMLLHGINTQFTRLLKRRTTPKHCNTTPFHFPINNSFGVENIKRAAGNIYNDIMGLYNTINTEAKKALDKSFKKKDISFKGKKTQLEVEKSQITIATNQLDQGIEYAKEFISIAAELLRAVKFGTYPSYPHAVYTGFSYQLLYAIALSNYLFRYHVRKGSNTSPATSLSEKLKQIFSNESKTYNAGTFITVTTVGGSSAAGGKEKKEGKIVGVANSQVPEDRKQKTLDDITGATVKRTKHLENFKDKVRRAKFQQNDAYDKQKRIRDHIRGNKHVIVVPTRGTKIMLWTDINVFLHQHGGEARQGLSMLFKMKLLPRDMLKQITIASLETGALYRLSPDLKHGIDLIPYKKYPTVASLPNQVYNKYAFFIDQNAYSADFQRKIVLTMYPGDKVAQYSINEITATNIFDTKDTSFAPISLDLDNPKLPDDPSQLYTGEIWGENYPNKVYDIGCRTVSLVKCTRDNLLGTTQRQRCYVHQPLAPKAFIIAVLPPRDDPTSVLPKITELKAYKTGVYIKAYKIPELQHNELLAGLPLHVHPRDIWHLNMDSLICGACRVPVNHVRIATEYIRLKNIRNPNVGRLFEGDVDKIQKADKMIANIISRTPTLYVPVGLIIKRMEEIKVPYVGPNSFIEGFKFSKEDGSIEHAPDDYNRNSTDRTRTQFRAPQDGYSTSDVQSSLVSESEEGRRRKAHKGRSPGGVVQPPSPVQDFRLQVEQMNEDMSESDESDESEESEEFEDKVQKPPRGREKSKNTVESLEKRLSEIVQKDEKKKGRGRGRGKENAVQQPATQGDGFTSYNSKGTTLKPQGNPFSFAKYAPIAASVSSDYLTKNPDRLSKQVLHSGGQMYALVLNNDKNAYSVAAKTQDGWRLVTEGAGSIVNKFRATFKTF